MMELVNIFHMPRQKRNYGRCRESDPSLGRVRPTEVNFSRCARRWYPQRIFTSHALYIQFQAGTRKGRMKEPN